MQHETISIFEDYYNPFPNYKEHLTGLKVLADIVGKKNFTLQYDGTIQIKHYVGFFQHGHTRIQILPKIYIHQHKNSATAQEKKESLQFIYRLLLWSDFWKVKHLSPQLQGLENEDLLEIFIRIFSQQFLEVFRQHIQSEYIQREGNQQFIKGKILFSETIRRNPVLRHRHYVRYDEYSVDNLLNQIFKALILLLLKRTNNARNKQLLASGLAYLQDVRLIPLHAASFKAVKFNRLNQTFEPLFRLAELFFQNQQPSLQGGAAQTFCFLVPLNRLFEQFVGKLLEGLSRPDLVFRYHQPKKHLAKKGDKDVFLLEPDFTAYSGDKCVCILDAKYKNPLNDKGKVKVGTADLYQLCTYALRYGCRELVLIYPRFVDWADGESVLAEYDILAVGGGIRLRVLVVDVLKEQLETIISTLKKIIESFLCIK